MSDDKGRLVVISGPSGAGKTSVCRVLKENPAVEFSVSATTRAMRAGEQDGVDYHFLSREAFEQRLAEDQFLEYAEYNGNLYGTPRWPMDDALARGKTFLVEIEVDGTRQLRRRGVAGLYLFIEPPSIAELRAALRAAQYAYVGDHGCFGDQLWVHASTITLAERTLRVRIDPGADSGEANCACTRESNRGRPAARGPQVYPVGGSAAMPRKMNAVVRAAGGCSFVQARVQERHALSLHPEVKRLGFAGAA